MLDRKAMDTPMAYNLNLLSDSSSEKVNATIYHQMIGSLMYLMNTRLDIFFAVNTLSQFLADSRQDHLIAVKHVFRYLNMQWIVGTNRMRNRRLTYRFR